MRTADVAPIVRDMRHDVAEKLVSRHMPEKAYPEQWDVAGLQDEIAEIAGLDLPIDLWAKEEGVDQADILDRLMKEVDRAYAGKAATLGPERLRAIEKQVLLSVVDMRWREHLGQLDHLRSVIHLRGYARRDPLNEFKTEAFTLFERMLLDLRTTVTRMLMRLQIGAPEEEQAPPLQAPAQIVEVHRDPLTGENEMDEADAAPPAAGFDRTDPRTWGKVSRNAPCPCGSGKKYKYCHGDLGQAASA
ncbi:MAG: SEC-C metal-binding domain-containing protein, partial [Hyphomonadaceae bacterium]